MLDVFTDQDLACVPVGDAFTFDVECYPNYFLVVFRHVITDKVVYFESSPGASINIDKLSWLVWRSCLIGFNSNTYDLPLVAMALNGYDYYQIYEASKKIIYENARPSEIEESFAVQIPTLNHVDLIQVAPLEGSLKLYAGRLHCPVMQDLPYPPDVAITQEQSVEVLQYCCNDNLNTKLLLIELAPHIELRQNLGREYMRDLRSLSDAQVAEAIINTELHKALGYYPSRNKNPPATCTYQPPSWLGFQTPALQSALETVCRAVFTIAENGAAVLPASIAKLRLAIGQSVYKMGIGGLHSQEEQAAYKADANTLLIDRDVASYYPAIILNQGLYPKHLGPAFLHVYRSLVEKRLAAKKAGNKKVSEGLKIAINGIFGKFGNKWSTVYSPDLLLQVTLTGQLALLMLIEAIELAGIPVVSGNTDGIVIKCAQSRYDDLNRIIAEWEKATGFVTEETRYKAIYSRDVNNYIALKEDGTCKTKGAYCERGSAQNSILSKNPETLVCSDAVQALISNGTPIEETIARTKDIRRFVSIRNVKGGAMKNNHYLGRVVRWYYARGIVGTIQYKLSGNKVPKTDGAKPLMVMPEEIPNDIDFDWYIREATEILFDIGYYQRPKTQSLFTV
ncbi:MAG TPA: hypothetical protein VHK27_07120 [Gammaproteobacteria bacterium]|nr:hypothetical protein [Gammaproteobacteria bacterium]